MDQCNCAVCSGKGLPEERTAPVIEVQPTAPLSVFDQLNVLWYETKDQKVREVIAQVQDKVSDLSDDLHALQSDCVRRHIEYTQFKLAEINKGLF